MKVLLDYPSQTTPTVSIVLIDWSCRESFHILDYLSRQNVPRDDYEIIWIEFYGTQRREIDVAIRKSLALNQPRCLDKWIILDMPSRLYYHKHLMYNAGILASAGKIITFCDSDAVVTNRFVGSIIDSFQKDSNIVLHMDQVRNREKYYYPFNYPTIEQIIRDGRTNTIDGKPAGLSDAIDPIHTRNYGACMSANRDDLLAIGGADEHIDYLGYVCGPYEMTWRLVNLGRKELWHENEWTYHLWHPGQVGAQNYFGPHDGFHLSTTALAARQSRRILPLVENPAIARQRCSRQAGDRYAAIDSALTERDFSTWTISQIRLKFIWLGKLLMRKCLPRSVKTFLRSKFRSQSV